MQTVQQPVVWADVNFADVNSANCPCQDMMCLHIVPFLETCTQLPGNTVLRMDRDSQALPGLSRLPAHH